MDQVDERVFSERSSRSSSPDQTESPDRHANSQDRDDTDWVYETLSKIGSDVRTQPWKKALNAESHASDTGEEQGSDLVVVPHKPLPPSQGTTIEQASLAG